MVWFVNALITAMTGEPKDPLVPILCFAAYVVLAVVDIAIEEVP